MSKHLIESVDFPDAETRKDLRDKMEILMRDAVELVPSAGICLFVFYGGNPHLGVAHMSNVDKNLLRNIMEKWLNHKEGVDV